mgnify:CR=1 FL=1
MSENLDNKRKEPAKEKVESKQFLTFNVNDYSSQFAQTPTFNPSCVREPVFV